MLKPIVFQWTKPVSSDSGKIVLSQILDPDSQSACYLPKEGEDMSEETFVFLTRIFRERDTNSTVFLPKDAMEMFGTPADTAVSRDEETGELYVIRCLDLHSMTMPEVDSHQSHLIPPNRVPPKFRWHVPGMIHMPILYNLHLTFLLTNPSRYTEAYFLSQFRDTMERQEREWNVVNTGTCLKLRKEGKMPASSLSYTNITPDILDALETYQDDMEMLREHLFPRRDGALRDEP